MIFTLPALRTGALARVSGLLLACVFAAASHAAFVKNETLVSSQWDLIDAEYSQTRNAIVWSDSLGNLWLAGVDPVTGLFVPADGRGTLIDTNASNTSDLDLIGNGPEWITTAKGDQIVYTRFGVGVPHEQASARLALAETADGKVWTSRFLSANLQRNAPYASKDKGDKLPRISYVDPKGNHYWRNLYDSKSEKKVTAYPASFRSLRFVKGARAAVFVAPVAGIKQVHRVWLDTDVVEQLTFDAGNKDLHSVPWMWQAPEYANDYLLLTVVEDRELRVYRQVDPSTPAWEVVRTAVTPNNAILNSPEPFTYKSKSYVAFAAATRAPSYPTSLWLVNLDVSKPLLRQLTDDTTLRMRSDPEVYVTAEGAFLYFNRFDPSLSTTGEPNCNACSEGVFRSHTGLPLN